MSVGRNDPCPCGSGKKYKKCCLAKDEEATRKEAAALPVPAAKLEAPARQERPKPPPDPRIEAWNARYDEFEAADYEERVAILNRTLDEPELMDEEMAFEMFNQLFEQAAENNDRDRYDSLIESLRERLPDVYREEAHFLLENRITNALAMKRTELVDSLARELAPLAGDQIDTWNRVESRLAYHGYLSTLVEAMRLAWPNVRESDEIVPWGTNEFADQAGRYEMLHYIALTAEPRGGDPVLLEKLRFFFGEEFEPERVAETMGWLTGQTRRQWTMEDFKLEPPRSRTRGEWDDEEEDEEEIDPADQNLFDLTLQFVRYAHSAEGVPYTKAELARRELYRFITERHAGELEYRESMLDSALRSAGQKREPIRKYNRYDHLLCPDSERLDHFLAEMLQMLNYRPHNVAATMQMVPAWMRILQTEGLVDAALRKQTLDGLQQLATNLLKIFNSMHADPSLAEAIKRWPEDAEKEPQ